MRLHHYTFKSALRGSISCEEVFSDTDGVRELDGYDMAYIANLDDELPNFLNNMQEDLTAYLDDDLKQYMRKVTVGDWMILEGCLWLVAHAYTEEQLTDEGVAKLVNFLTGQYSDGWGESLEQQEWKVETVTYRTTNFNVASSEWYEDQDYAQAYFNLTPWWTGDFSLEEHDVTIEEFKDPEPDVSQQLAKILDELLSLQADILEIARKAGITL